MTTKQKQERKQIIKERAVSKETPSAKKDKPHDDYEAAKADAYRLENEGKWDEAVIAWGVVIDFATTTKDKKTATGRKAAAKVRASAAAKALEEQMEAQMAREEEQADRDAEQARADRDAELKREEEDTEQRAYSLDGEVTNIKQVIADKTILNGIRISDADVIREMPPGQTVRLEGELTGNFTLRCMESVNKAGKRYTIEGDEIDLEQFIELNAEPRGALTSDTIEQLRALTPGDEVEIHAFRVEYSIRCEAMPTVADKPKATTPTATKPARDPRLPPVGTVIIKKDRTGNERARCTVVEGGIEYKGTMYKSLSAAGLKAMANLGLSAETCDGFAFWGLKKGEATAKLKSIDFDQIEKVWGRYRALIEQAVKSEDADQREKANVMHATHLKALGQITAV